MYSLSISFGPTGTVWALLFKEEKKAGEAYNSYMAYKMSGDVNGMLIGSDDFGQSYAIPVSAINGILIEDLEQIEAARIQRALIDERCKAKFMQAAKTDPVIRAAMPGGVPILQGGFGRG